MLKTVLKHCLIDLKDGKSQRGRLVRLSIEHQLFFLHLLLFLEPYSLYDIDIRPKNCRAYYASSFDAL